MLKNAFLYRVALHELKKQPFSAKQKFSIYRKLYELHSKPLSYAQKLFCTCLSSLSAKNPHFHKTKAVLLPKLFLIPTQNNSFPPSASHSHHPLPTVCKEYSRSFAVCVNSLCCKAGTSHRFKSLPAMPGEVAAFRKTGYLMKAGHFRKNILSTGDLNRGRRTSPSP